MSNSLWQRCGYCRYLVIGATVGLSAIILRDIIGRVLPADTPFYYGLSIVIVYGFGITAGFLGHRSVSFRAGGTGRGAMRETVVFVAIALLGMVATTVLSTLFRYGLPLEEFVGGMDGAFAFGMAATLASILTFWLNSRFTFRKS